jgi:pectate lyase
VFKSLFLVGILSLSVSLAHAQEFDSPLPPQFNDGAQRAFPTAEGYGALALGGRGGKVIHVTNLKDEGSGSLRSALSGASGPRTIVFDVGGVINLSRNIVIKEGNVTVAGQTAPGDGVCLRGGTISVKASDVIIRHICIRRGDGPGSTRSVGDGFQFDHARRAIADHLSVSWSLDEALETYFPDTEDITIQYSLFYEPLNGMINESENNHGYGPLLGNEGQRQSFHHNVIGHALRRSPRLANVQDIDVVNNIVFNWGKVATEITNGSKGREPASRINVINNVYRPGNDSTGAEVSVGSGSSQIFVGGNEDHQGWPVGDVSSIASPNPRPNRAAINTQDPAEVWDTLLDRAGARVPVTDQTDALFLAVSKAPWGTILPTEPYPDPGASTPTATGWRIAGRGPTAWIPTTRRTATAT